MKNLGIKKMFDNKFLNSYNNLMGKIKKVIQIILNLGISESLSEKKQKRVRITNVLALTTTLLVIPLYFVFEKIGADFLKIMIPIVITYQISILILNKKGFVNLSRFLAPNLNAIIIFIYSTSLGPDTMYFFFYFPAISASFLYYELEEKKIFLFQIFFSSILIILDLFIKVTPFPSVYLSPKTTVIVSYIMIVAGFLLFLICLYTLAAETKIAEKSLIKAKMKAEAATEAKSDFLARMSHEIRTPMNAVIGLTHLAMGTELSDKQYDYLKKIQKSSQALLTIINDILDFSKIEAGKLVVENIKFNLQTVLDNLYSIVNLKASKKGIEVHFDIDEKIPESLKGDPLRLGQVLINLTDNAVKFSNRGSIVISIELIDGKDENVRIKFSVRDEGIGLTSDQISNLFKSFHQVDGSITRRFGGTGLGLVISKQLVELMGGKLSVESIYGKGTLFFFEIPFLPATNSYGFGINDVLPENYNGAKVLLVEDNPLNQQVISELIEQMGLEYDLAVNGREGYQMACKNKYDLVFMDIQMPEMDGLSAAREIRSHGLKDLPIVAMTAHAMVSDKEKSLQAGMNDHLTKPIDPEELSKVVKKFIKPAISNKMTEEFPTPELIKHSNPLLPNIDGLDVKNSVKRLNGSKMLYIKLLGEYVKLYKNVERTLKSLIENNEVQKALHLVHSLRGASSTMGMYNVSTLAAKIEQNLLDGNTSSALETLAVDEELLKTMIDEIEYHFLSIESSIIKESEQNYREQTDLFPTVELIRNLIEFCNSGDSEALDVAEQLQSVFLEGKHSQVVSEILGLVEDVEFSKAAELANKILREILE